MERWIGRVRAVGVAWIRRCCCCCCGSAKTEGVRKERTEEQRPSVEDKSEGSLDLPSAEVERPASACFALAGSGLGLG